MGNNLSTFYNNFYFWKLTPTTSAGESEDCVSNSQNSNKIKKEVKNGKYHDAFSLLRKQRLGSLKNVIFGYLNLNSLQNKFDSISELIQGKLCESFPSNKFTVFGFKFIRKNRNKLGVELLFISMLNYQAGPQKLKILQRLRF